MSALRAVPRPGWAFAAVALLAAVLLLGANGLSRAALDVATTLVLYATGAVAWNLVGGFGGLFSLASSAMVGAGSYTAILVLRGTDLGLASVLVASVLVGGVLSAVVGAVLLRLRGAYFTVGSLGIAVAALSWMTVWSLTGATRGVGAPLAEAPSRGAVYLLSSGLLVLSLAGSTYLAHSRVGLRLRAVRDDEDVADSLGVAPGRLKLAVMAVSGGLLGPVGALFALQVMRVEPYSAFSLTWSITFIVMSIVGGLGTVWGPVLGAVVIYFGLTVQLQGLPTIGTIVSGVVMVLVIRFFPAGLLGLGAALLQRTRRSEPVEASTS